MDSHGDGENYRIDTLFTNRPTENHILVGATKLPGSGKPYSGYGYGYWFEDFVGSNCNSHSEKEAYGNDKVLEVQRTDSTLIVNCRIGANCCYDFLGDVFFDDNGILNLFYYGYGEYCACNCCFGLVYSFSTVDTFDDETQTLKGIMINGEEETLYKLE